MSGVRNTAISGQSASVSTLAGRVAFPETERRRLRAGVEYFWTVLDGDGDAEARSFQIGSPP